MDAPPNQDNSIAPFLQVGDLLLKAGFSAPKIIAKDVPAGMLLLAWPALCKAMKLKTFDAVLWKTDEGPHK